MKIAIEVLKSRLNSDLKWRDTVARKDPHCSTEEDLRDQKEELDRVDLRIRGYRESLKILEVASQAKEMSLKQVQEISTKFTYRNGELDENVGLEATSLQVVEHIKLHSRVVL